MTDKNKVAIIGVSDLHINSTVALCPPSVPLDDGGEYRASREQRQLWDWWLDFCAWAKDETASYRRIGVICGDLGELDTKRRSMQLITGNKATILSLTLKAIEPFLSMLDGLIVIRGTPAHVGKAAWLEEDIAADLDFTIPGRRSASHYQWRGKAAGVRFDIAHHTSMGRLPWTEKQAATKLAAQTVMEYALMGDDLPHIVIRAHNHRWSIDNNYPVHAYIMPSWSYPTEYTYRIGAYNGMADIGGGVWLCENGEYTWKKRGYTLPRAVKRIWANSL